MKKIFYLCVLMISLTIISCKKQVTEADEPATAAITLDAPVENQSYAYGDTVKINGLITADLALHGYQVRLVNLSTGVNVLNQEYHLHQTSIVISESWKNTVSDTAQMKIIIDAAIDHNGNQKTLERMIVCYPQ